MVSESIYLADNCSVAYQLNWSLSVFGKTRLPSPECVIDKLQASISKDDLRILDFRQLDANVAQFFISSRPKHSPASIVRSIKGRWQYAARDTEWIRFRRNYRITSLGASNSDVLDAYVASQTQRHPMVDLGLQAMLESLQFHDPKVEPAAVRRSCSGEFAHALQVVLETDSGWSETRLDVLTAYREMIIETCQKHNWLLSRIGLLSNHMHILLSAGVDDSPQDIALSLLNDLARTQGMRPVFKFGYYVGTYGEYDRGVVWNARREIVSEESECFLQVL